MQYSRGTVAVTNGSPTVSGTGTAWLANVAAGDLFTVRKSGVTYEVGSVGGDGAITLTSNYLGQTGTALEYAISRSFSPIFRIPYPEPRDIEAVTVLKQSVLMYEGLLKSALSPEVVTYTTNPTLDATAHRGKIIQINSPATALTLPLAADVEVGWRVYVSGIGVTVNLQSSDTINGGASIVVSPGTWVTKSGTGTWTNYDLTSGTLPTLATGMVTFLGAPSSANLRATITDETGTGSLVFATSPTLVTPILGVASATSVAFAAGAVGTPSITATGDLDTGIWFPAANTLAFSVGGAEALRVTSSGNVGIGVVPTYRLSVATAAATNVRAVDIGGSTTGFSYASFSNTTGSLWWGVEGSIGGQIFSSSLAYASLLGSSNATALQLASNGTVRMTFDTSGNVVVGSTSASGKLHVVGGNANNFIVDNGGGQFTDIGIANNNVRKATLSWDNTNTKFSFTLSNAVHNWSFANGNVGIAEGNAPTQALSIYRVGSTATYISVGNSNTGLNGVLFGVATTGEAEIRQVGNLDLQFWTFGIKRMVITGGGNVCVGAATPTSRFVVNGGALATSGADLNISANLTTGRLLGSGSGNIASLHTFTDAGAIEITAGSSSTYVSGIGIGSRSFGGTSADAVTIWTRSAERLRVISTGEVGIGMSDPAYQLEVGKTTGGVIAVSTAGSSGSNVSPLFTTLNFLGYTDKVKASITVEDRETNAYGGWMNFNVRDSSDVLQKRMTITSTGNVGIGTTSPDVFGRGYSGCILGLSSTGQTALEINSATGNAAYLDMGVNGTRIAFLYSDTTAVQLATTGAQDLSLNTTGSSVIWFGTNNAERMRVTSTGIVGIGISTTPGSLSGAAICLANAGAVPTGNPVSGGVLYSEGGALKWRSAGGTTTTLAAN